MADTEIRLVLEEVEHLALLDARKKRRTAMIKRNDAERRRARHEKKKGANHADTKKAAKDRDDFGATAKTHDDAFKTALDAVMAKYHKAATDFSDIGHDAVQGHIVCSTAPRLAGTPSVERQRLELTDKQADDFSASYVASCEAQDDAFDLMRQIEAYRVAHPALFAGSPGLEPPPVDPVYEKLKSDLDTKQTLVREEHAKQGVIMTAVLNGAEAYHVLVNIETGEIVLGDKAE
jgi:hypothetical protein